MLSLEDRMAIMELIALHGHLVDDGRLDELSRMFAENVTHDLMAFGLGVHHGLSSVRESALALGDANPIGHHVTNIVIVEVKDDDTVVTQSKGIGIRADGTVGSVVYEDTLIKRDGKWCITYRKITVVGECKIDWLSVIFRAWIRWLKHRQVRDVARVRSLPARRRCA